jgi:serine/threonine protein kinase
MAEVFLAVAQSTAVTKLVVLKRIWPDLASDSSFAAMFLNEARLSALMSHPNVVQTYDVIEQSGRLIMAMEYLDGQPLTRVMSRLFTPGGVGQLTVAQRLRIVIDILAGLEHVHELTDYEGRPLGVVHRDVSPHNVFITYDGHVKLMDFGVAKTVAASQLTDPGTIKGKVAYMAPEQLGAAPLDRRADIFSVGVILWEMLSQGRLWSGMSEVEIVRHLSYRLPLPRLAPDASLPAGVVEVCHRALALNPANRFATAAEMQEELQRLLLPDLAGSYARQLGRTVSRAFAEERELRQALIDRHLLTLASPDDRENREGGDDDGLVTVEAGCVDAWSSDGGDTSRSRTDGTRPEETPDQADSGESPTPLPVAPAHPRRWRWSAAAFTLAALAVVGARVLDFRPNRAGRPAVTSDPVIVPAAALPAASPSGAASRTPSEESQHSPLPLVVAGRPQIELLSAPAASRTGESEEAGREGGGNHLERRRSRRAPGKHWALRDEAWRLGGSHAAKHRSNSSSESVTFSFEAREAAPPGRRREIDTKSPFFP